MEAFKIFMLKFLRRKTKVLFCLKMENKTKQKESEESLQSFFKEKENGMKNGDIEKRESFQKRVLKFDREKVMTN